MASISRHAGSRIKQDLEPYLPTSRSTRGLPGGGAPVAQSVSWGRWPRSTCSSCRCSASTPPSLTCGIWPGHAVNAAAYCKARMRLPLAVVQTTAAAKFRCHAQFSGMRRRRRGVSAGAGCGPYPGRRLQHDHARHARLAKSLRTAHRPEGGVRLSRAQAAGAVRRLHRAGGRSDRVPAVHPRAVQGLATASAAQAPATCWSGTAGSAPSFTWRCWPPARCGLLPHAPAADGRLPPTPQRRTPSKQAAQGQGNKSRARAATSTFVRRLGKHDQVVRWKRPSNPPSWMSAAQWALMPEWLEVRELRYALQRKGQRTLW